jgi:hypothetical protein
MHSARRVETDNPPPSAATKWVAAPLSQHIAEMTGFGKNTGVTVGRVQDAMTTFYNDYRNAPLCWGDALQFCVWSLNGNPATEGVIDLARKRGGESGCK